MRTNWTIRSMRSALLVTALLLAPAMAMPQTLILDYPQARATYAHDIDNQGNVVGTFYAANGVPHGFLYAPGTGGYTEINYPGADWTQVTGIRALGGTVVGYYGYNTESLFHGFSLSLATWKFSRIDHGGHWNTMPQGVAPSGDVLGCVHNAGAMFGWVLRDGDFTDATVGQGWTGSSMYTAAGEAGQLVGWYWSAHVVHSFLIDEAGQRTSFEYPGATNTQAWGTNFAGCTVGWYGPSSASRGFTRGPGGNFDSFDFPGATWTRILGMTYGGNTIVGAYRDGSGVHGFLTQVPCD